MTEETRRLAADLVWNDRNFMELFSADYTFLNSDLAALYKLPAPPVEFVRVTLPPETGRAGILGQGTFLALTSKPEETSPTARGLFVREQFLCQEVPPPPPGVNTNLPANSKDAPHTNQERLAMHLTNESCASCHSLIDPIGFGLEKYDAIGQHRDKLNVRFIPSHGDREKTTSIDVPAGSPPATSPASPTPSSIPRAAWASVLARTPQCQECVVKQLFRYAVGPPRNRHRPASLSTQASPRFPRFRLPLQRTDGISGKVEYIPHWEDGTDGVSCN